MYSFFGKSCKIAAAMEEGARILIGLRQLGASHLDPRVLI